jgi:hypothetical protein
MAFFILAVVAAAVAFIVVIYLLVQCARILDSSFSDCHHSLLLIEVAW